MIQSINLIEMNQTYPNSIIYNILQAFFCIDRIQTSTLRQIWIWPPSKKVNRNWSWSWKLQEVYQVHSKIVRAFMSFERYIALFTKD
jgi:hypothetical protein